MKKIHLVLVVSVFFLLTSIITARALVKTSSSPTNPGHGTHLCTIDDDCGVGHKCCEGHCLMVDVCP